MRVDLVRVGARDRDVLDRLAQLYMYDFSEFDGSEIGPDGRFRFVDFERLFAQTDHRAYLIKADGSLAGFATAYRGDAFRDPDETIWWMDEFFVLRTHRRRGVGRTAATKIFDELGGTWEVGQIRTNAPARAFWRAIVGDYTQGDYEELELDDDRWSGTVQYFRTRRP